MGQRQRALRDPVGDSTTTAASAGSHSTRRSPETISSMSSPRPPNRRNGLPARTLISGSGGERTRTSPRILLSFRRTSSTTPTASSSVPTGSCTSPPASSAAAVPREPDPSWTARQDPACFSIGSTPVDNPYGARAPLVWAMGSRTPSTWRSFLGNIAIAGESGAAEHDEITS